jgi:hypothetical protein
VSQGDEETDEIMKEKKSVKIFCSLEGKYEHRMIVGTLFLSTLVKRTERSVSGNNTDNNTGLLQCNLL